MAVEALIIDCTLQRSPHPSTLDTAVSIVAALFREHGAPVEVIRPIDHEVRPGLPSHTDTEEGAPAPDELGRTDPWGWITHRVLTSNVIVIATSTWFGAGSSVAHMLIERLAARTFEHIEHGHYALYNSVGACIVTGDEMGGGVAEWCLHALQRLGAVIAPNADCHWTEPEPKHDSLAALRESVFYAQAVLMVGNSLALARRLEASPLRTSTTGAAYEAISHVAAPAGTEADHLIDRVDEAGDESFPASDPPSFNPGVHF